MEQTPVPSPDTNTIHYEEPIIMQHAENTAPADLLLKEQLHKYIEEMDEYQARLVLSFLKTLFNLSD